MLETLHSTHHREDPAAMTTGKAQEKQRTGIQQLVEQELLRNVTTEPLDTQGQIERWRTLSKRSRLKPSSTNLTHRA